MAGRDPPFETSNISNGVGQTSIVTWVPGSEATRDPGISVERLAVTVATEAAALMAAGAEDSAAEVSEEVAKVSMEAEDPEGVAGVSTEAEDPEGVAGVPMEAEDPEGDSDVNRRI